MSTWVVIDAIGILLLILIGLAIWWWRFRPGKLDSAYYKDSWQAIQKLCRSKTSWAEAIISADQLLAQALKKKRVRGRTMGAQLVAIQRILSDNDGVWSAHKLRSKLETDAAPRLKQVDVKEALVSIRQALKDIGALQ